MITEDDEFERIEREQKMRLEWARDNIDDLTEAGLEKMLKEIRQMLADEPITMQPTKLLIRPAALAELGLTVDDVKKMLKEHYERKERR
jgi:hypothetical protein